ncbi:MAG: Glycosyl transferase family protein [Candidatus Daviesbacteria bacterium GW2011_GWA1_41_61]|uniref:Glycosyl transferase family protein n=1 Tax=Candidatus Daviesbacteria bacterium GW2011_GWA2_40_9 TaxID=1618424 RepID=A0A0G0WDK5_9BACT|nr:MAG: Glycosyl transferase family protein [Candidatus Daviesbacteria bacterium GW2011_GWC1_40_9]KKR82345.1 MAG: Glycosyl transferase family protein [Candidatus Daviesbacteria bacterium GW2011_GWA2_40_9]KKR92998.1 MAG: Glycosyl transferase family protein [Candidatus Daviesbacteria bacterium GW2011_GWB1_41_15]KKS15542.1 MAG: Glycosyl transferase family protein [Candidatus Daviesbacteria bacterium GW2011_GWA1_41_61]
MKSLFISFVVPMYNEQECAGILYARILSICKKIGANFELICINDGSFDNTLSILKKLRKKDPRVKIISFARNFGHQIAIVAGLKYAHGNPVVVMDADLQDPPEIIPQMLAKWRQGFKVIYGIREDREEMWLKKICYKAFYRLLLKMSPLKNIPLDAGDFCLMDKKVVAQMRKFKEDRPFIRGLRTWVGFKQMGIEYHRPPRMAGKTKYSLAKLFHLAFDGLLSFSSLALKMTIFAGLIISFFSISYAAYISISRILIMLKIINSNSVIPGWTTPVVSITFLMGLQFIFLGIMGEYISRIYSQSKDRPPYVIEEKLGLNGKLTGQQDED